MCELYFCDIPPEESVLYCSVAREYSCGFLSAEVAPIIACSQYSLGQAIMEQLLLWKFLQPYSQCNTAQKSTLSF